MSVLTAHVIVFAKAPVAGQAKTRLAPALGAAGAAALAERLLDHAVAQAVAANLGSVALCVTPHAAHPAFQRLRARHGLALTLQGDGDLGTRMHRAITQALTQPLTQPPERHRSVLLIGSDAPALTAAVLRAAAAALDDADADAGAGAGAGAGGDADAVFVPALDGGYVLVGLRRPAPALFANVAWSTGQVMAMTRQRAAAAGLRLAELPALADIDEPADLVHLQHLPGGWPA